MAAESETLCDSFVDICSRIPRHDVVSFAKELLKNGLRILTDVPKNPNSISRLFELVDEEGRVVPSVTQLVSDAISRVGDSRSKFERFVDILESRDSELRSNLRSNYLNRRLSAVCKYHDEEQASDDHHEFLPPSPKRRKEHDFCAEYVARLRQAYQAPPPHCIWDPFPQCQHIKLSIIKRKGKRYGTDEFIAESRVLGEVGEILSTSAVQDIDADKLFNAGIFDEDRQVILVEGVSGMGKTSLSYYYCQKWAKGELKYFDVVALVCLRDLPNEMDLSLQNILHYANTGSVKPMKRKWLTFS